MSDTGVSSDNIFSFLQIWGYRLLLWGNLIAICLYVLYKLLIFIRVFACKYIMVLHHRKVGPRKQNLFKNNIPQGKQLRIAELGTGAGLNLTGYPEGTWLTAIEPFADIRPAFEKAIEAQSRVKLEQYLCSGAESMPQLADASFDIVLSTFTLCSVQNLDKVFAEVARILKPGGRFIFIEHVRSPNCFVKLLQYLMQPLHYLISDGCMLVRQPQTNLNPKLFEITHCEEFEVRQFYMYILYAHVECVAVRK